MADWEIKNRRSAWVFVTVTALVIAQVVWWTTVFMQDVVQISQLQSQLVQKGLLDLSLDQISKEAFHRRMMFFSESVFFVVMAVTGLWLLFRALKSEQGLRKTQRNFIEVMAHESKTPLTALKLRLESIRDKGDSSKDIPMAIEEVRRLSGIIEKVLQLNRMETDAFRFESVDLTDVVREVLRRMEPVFRSKNTDVEFSATTNVFVNGDVFGLQNTVQSLLENSVLYNDAADKRIHVTIRKTQGQAFLCVSDNGSGIPEKDSERVFDRFYRGGNSRRVAGTGLGLYLARMIAVAHQGMLRLAKDKGPGTHFELELPLMAGLA